MKIAVYSTKPYEQELFEAKKPEGFEVCYIEDWLRAETVSLSSGCDAVLIFVNDDASEKVLRELAKSGVKFIALRSAGYDNVNLKVAKELGICVSNVPNYPPYAVAEMAVTLMMALNRHLIKAEDNIDKLDFRLNGLMGFNFHGKTVGIVGLGNIGQVLAKIMNGFGCRVIGYDPKPDEEFQKTGLVEFVDFDYLCANSHIISLNCPLNEQTKYMINTNSIAKMRPQVMLINAGRGGIVDTQAALDALNSGQIGYLGLDVYEKEKGIFFNDRSKDNSFDPVLLELIQHENVIITSHQGFFTKESLESIISTTYNNLIAMHTQVPCENLLA